MARPTNAKIFVRHLREAGGRLPNTALIRMLGWTEDKYLSVRQELIDAEVIAKGRGQGGTVILLVPETEEEAFRSVNLLPEKERASVSEELVRAKHDSSRQYETREIDLYEPALNQIRKNWSRYKRLHECVCHVTAHQGRRDTGGNWSRPDIVAIGSRKFDYIPDKLVELYSFEIKTENDISIKGVLEALSHREMSTRSYVIYHTGGRSWDDFPEASRIEQLAPRHGVGVIVAADIHNFELWDERISATRSSSDPEALDDFIRKALPDDTKSRIKKMF